MKNYPMLFPQGTMKPLGIALLIAGIGFTFNIEKIIAFLIDYKIIFGIVLIATGYFDVIAGRRFPRGPFPLYKMC